jgi:uncharacterized protein YggE
MRQLFALVLILLVAVTMGVAQQQREAPGPRPRTVTVRGTGTTTAEPDRIRLSMQVMVRGESASSAMTTASQRTREVLDLLLAHGVTGKDIQTTRVAVTPVYDYEKRVQPPPIVGYSATNDFSAIFKAGSMDKLGEFLDKAVEAGASNFGSLMYESSDERGLLQKALAQAAKDARARAEVLAKELGAGVGRVLTVTETGVTTPTPIVHDFVQMEASQRSAAPVMTGEMEVVAHVDVVFELVEP